MYETKFEFENTKTLCMRKTQDIQQKRLKPENRKNHFLNSKNLGSRGSLEWCPLLCHPNLRSQPSCQILEASWGLLRLPGASWNYLGASSGILGSSWGLLGSSWGILGPSWGHLEASWGHLGAIWGPLGASWGHLGAILGPPSGHLGSILGPSWVQGALQQET